MSHGEQLTADLFEEIHDPATLAMFRRIPDDIRDTFTVQQIRSIERSLAKNNWQRHSVDLRGSIGFWRWRYFYVLLAGRESRRLSRAEVEVARTVRAFITFCFLVFCTVLGLGVLYILKSALDIDLLPGVSLGGWTWFKNTF